MTYYELFQMEKYGNVIPPAPPVTMDDDEFDRWMKAQEDLELIEK